MKVLIIFAVLFALGGCASVSETQKYDLKKWEQEKLLVEDSSASTAAWLNVLPGIGDFYNGNIGYGVLNLLTWPLSVLWAPIGGSNGADVNNWHATKTGIDELEQKKNRITNKVREKYEDKEISEKKYRRIMRRFENTPLYTFKFDPMIKRIIAGEDEERLPANE